jgi:hypothetical protein
MLNYIKALWGSRYKYLIEAVFCIILAGFIVFLGFSRNWVSMPPEWSTWAVIGLFVFEMISMAVVYTCCEYRWWIFKEAPKITQVSTQTHTQPTGKVKRNELEEALVCIQDFLGC